MLAYSLNSRISMLRGLKEYRAMESHRAANFNDLVMVGSSGLGRTLSKQGGWWQSIKDTYFQLFKLSKDIRISPSACAGA